MRTRAPDIGDLEARRAASIPRMVTEANIFAREYILEELERRGHGRVGLAHGVLLRNMDFEGSPLSEVAQRAGVTRQAVAKVAAELVELGYVRTETSVEDARVKIVSLTARGEALVSDSIAVYEQIEAEFRRIIGATRLEAMRSTLKRLTAGLRK